MMCLRTTTSLAASRSVTMPFDAIFLHGQIRAGLGPEINQPMILDLVSAAAEVTRTYVSHVRVDSIAVPARQIAEWDIASVAKQGDRTGGGPAERVQAVRKSVAWPVSARYRRR